MFESFKEVSPEIIEDLKSQGYVAVKFDLHPLSVLPRATVEVTPFKKWDYDMIRFSSEQINHYLGEQSPLAQYVIHEKYLSPKGGDSPA